MGNDLLGLARRVACIWLVSVVFALSGQGLDSFLVLTSVVASIAEGVLVALNHNKDIRRTCRNLFFGRLATLFLVQGSCLLIRQAQQGQDVNVEEVAPEMDVTDDTALELAENKPAVLGKDIDGEPFDVDAEVSSLVWTPKTISVILPCAEERDYAMKTVKSVFENTPVDILAEIIVVDDGSNPPLSQTHLTEDVQSQYKVKIVRHESTIGLIGAKKDGGDAASGDILVFFDCHVAPQPKWYEDFLKLIGENWRRMVVPEITALNIDSWTQVGGSGMAKCYLTLDVDFKWFNSDDMYMPAISGGLLGMSKRWFRETGGYDSGMLGWGGENLDQSLRVWLCGGEIVAAPRSQVAHMWRTGDARTAARYKRIGSQHTNRARAAYAWFGEFADKLKEFPAFSRTGAWYGDLSNILSVKDRLKCRSLAWFFRRFKHIYEDAGLVPPTVFMLKHQSTGKCLQFSGGAGTSYDPVNEAYLRTCNENAHRQFWHLGNRGQGSGKKCCSGLHAWNTDQCLSALTTPTIKLGVCDVSGRDRGQHWEFKDGQLYRESSRQCIDVAEGDRLTAGKCGQNLRAETWVKVAEHEPIERVLYKKAQDESPQMFVALDRHLKKLGLA